MLIFLRNSPSLSYPFPPSSLCEVPPLSIIRHLCPWWLMILMSMCSHSLCHSLLYPLAEAMCHVLRRAGEHGSLVIFSHNNNINFYLLQYLCQRGKWRAGTHVPYVQSRHMQKHTYTFILSNKKIYIFLEKKSQWKRNDIEQDAWHRLIISRAFNP